MKVAFLYTLSSNQALFAPYIAHLQDAQVFHHVNEQLLEDARAIASPQDEATVTNQVHRVISAILERDRPDKIICTCSTIGSMAESYNSDIVLRVDRPMATTAVHYPAIQVLAALESTLQPTKDLLDECAVTRPTPIIQMTVVPHAWSKFQEGRGYAETIANYIVEQFGNSSSNSSLDDTVIVLAQASMSPAVELVEKRQQEQQGLVIPRILTSPSICIEYLQNAHNK